MGIVKFKTPHSCNLQLGDMVMLARCMCFKIPLMSLCLRSYNPQRIADHVLSVTRLRLPDVCRINPCPNTLHSMLIKHSIILCYTQQSPDKYPVYQHHSFGLFQITCCGVLVLEPDPSLCKGSSSETSVCGTRSVLTCRTLAGGNLNFSGSPLME